MSQVTLSNRDNRATIAISGDFVFDINRNFREAYQTISPDTAITIDLSRSAYMDSAGLGMLLQLRGHAGGDKADITLKGVNDTIETVLTVANFGRLFVIQS